MGKEYSNQDRPTLYGLPVKQFLRKLDSWFKKNPEKRSITGTEISQRLKYEARKMELMKKINTLSRRDSDPETITELLATRRSLKLLEQNMKAKYETR